MRLEPSGGLTDSVHHVYWTGQAAHRGEPAAAFEAERIDWLPLHQVPALIADGQIRASVTVAALICCTTAPRQRAGLLEVGLQPDLLA